MSKLSLACAAVVLLFQGFVMGQTTVKTNAPSFAALAVAAETLCKLGLGNPKNGEYRELEVEIGDIWGLTNAAFKTHGWILGPIGNTNTTAVCWNGLVYRPRSIGSLANVTNDVAQMLRNEPGTGGTGAPRWSYRMGNAPPEAECLSYTNYQPSAPILLYQANQPELARKVFQEWFAGLANDSYREPFLVHSVDWTWDLFNRAICAHMRGADDIALSDARILARIRPMLESELQKRATDKGLSSEDGERFILGFLEPLDALLKDQERRAVAPLRKHLDIEVIKKIPDAGKRIATYIAYFDELQARQWSQPGGVWLGREPLVEAVVAEGDQAVEALLECAEQDQRLTRSVSFHRDFFTYRHPLTVKDAARSALAVIFKISFGEDTAGYRAYWNQHKDAHGPERWYELLKDDRADRKLWLQAAKNILGRSHGEQVYQWGNFNAQFSATNTWPLTGESLRKKKNPSVSDLLERRALEIASTNYVSSDDCWKFSDATDLGSMLAEWDKQAASRVLGKIIRRCPVFFAGRDYWKSGCDIVPRDFASLAITMGQLGDLSGLDLYAKWISTATLDELKDAVPGVLRPMSSFPRHPSIVEASAKLFAPTNGDWLQSSTHPDILRTGLVSNQAFQKLIVTALDDRTAFGTITLQKGDNYSIKTKLSSGGGGLRPDAFASKLDQPVSFRVCDDIGHRLARIKDMPKLELYWTEGKRDEALVAIKNFFKAHGTNLTLSPPSWLDSE